ncbi:MAG: hypothetical protein C0467_17130 [Planctomycetaceae bacterium]|nr:hypothetical protein [Planctomycetaceae bacterium]
MIRPTTTRRGNRRGNILIVTLSLLALMAVVGITAVYYTKDQAERARIQGQPRGGGEGFSSDGTSAATAFLNAFIYDTADTGAGLLNSARGHSLMATMYGRTGPGNTTPYRAWSGPGTFSGATTAPAFGGLDHRQLVNFRLFPGMTVVCDPEYTGERAPAATPTGTYYGKNAPYTYPDIKDFYLAALCPATGEVVVPSFHRNNAAGFGTLIPPGQPGANANWTNAQGKYLTPRPRPQEHPGFPYVPANQDGTYTGDVQNLPGGFNRTTAAGNAVSYNDSIWMDTGLPPITLPNGTRVKPLIAPLILDLNGRINLNVHGNVMNAGAHASGNGLGPWEVNLSLPTILGPTEGPALVNLRGLAQRRDGGAPTPPGTSAQKAFASSRYSSLLELPLYSQIAWKGITAANSLQLPGSGSAPLFATAPTYLNGYTNNNDKTFATFVNHPSLYNPTEWPTTAGTPRAFPATDTKLLTERYAPYPFSIKQLSFATTTPSTLTGTGTLSNPNPPKQTTPNPYRTDTAHALRQLCTTHSFSLDRASLMPGTGVTVDPNAGLGAIDLNRQLADYRLTTNTPLTPANAGNAAVANQERQTFAMDIFARLVAASSDPTTEASVNPTTAVVTLAGTATPGTPAYDKVRNLAQLAANIVDYIDSDDVCTRFAWNTPTPTEVVYGVEKPRLVINEAYSEVSNDPTDEALTDTAMPPTKKASKDTHVRFWVELQNPTTNPYTSTTTNPLGDGSAKVKYTAAELGGTPAFTPYQLLIVRNNKTGTPVINRLRIPTDTNYPGNVTGDPPGTAPTFGADIVFDFSPASTPTTQSILPANGVADGGMVICAADVPAAPNPAVTGWSDYNPTFPAAKTIKGTAMPNAIGGSTSSLAYPIPLTLTPDTDVPNTLGRHVILLRRLANPYVAYDATTNPYITIDILDHVRSADRILLKKDDILTAVRTARMAVGGAGYEPSAGGSEALWPKSIGKVQPYAGYSDPAQATSTTATLVTNYPTTTMVVQQDPSTPASGVKQTFLRQNSKAATAPATAVVPPADTMVAPYDWLVHMDRPLINQIELLHTSIGRSHDVTTNFVSPGGTKYSGSVQTALLANTYPQIYRALEVLTVQPYGQQTALGGRVPGKININTIQDKRVFQALLDAQGYDTFNSAFVDTLWTQFMATRTTSMQNRVDVAGTTYSCPIPGISVHDQAGGTDRPFLPFGVSTATAGAIYASGTNLDDTLLRRNPVGTGVPHLAVPPVTGHPYQQAEAIRKILNNTTTVSNNFAVWITVGYFEVASETVPGGWPAGVPAPVILGKEYYQNAPGDTRRKFFAIVDRSNVGLDVASFQANPATATHATVRPFFTTVEANAAVGATSLQISTAGNATVVSDGVPVTFAAGSQLVIGVGANQEIVTVTPTSFADGVTTMTVAPAFTKPHYAGECVSNVVPGNPGPQTAFDVNSDTYKPVVPLWVKLP